MKKNNFLIFGLVFILTVFCLNLIVGGTLADEPFVRILIKEVAQDVSINCDGRIRLTADNGKVLSAFSRPWEDKPLVFSPLSSGININGEKYEANKLTIIPIGGKPIKIGDFHYRGQIIIHLNNRWRLEVINKIRLEEYLKGLMKAEISPAWPLESLKAQAIVARTYALYQIERNRLNGIYDLKATTQSQVYKGISGEDPRSSRAVDETKGLVLVFNDKFLPALYHACCGGQTENAEYVFYDHPSLVGVPCNYCFESPHFEWEVRISSIKIRNSFLRQYYRMGPIEEFRIMERTPNDRVETLIISHSLGQEIINGRQLRNLMGNDIIRSTLLSITKDMDFFIFKGRGWGHGVGLCQWGAKYMAEKGAGYKDILGHYYPLASIEDCY